MISWYADNALQAHMIMQAYVLQKTYLFEFICWPVKWKKAYLNYTKQTKKANTINQFI